MIVPKLTHAGKLGAVRVLRVARPNQIVAYTPRRWESAHPTRNRRIIPWKTEEVITDVLISALTMIPFPR
jgi:hypothetical protein